MTLALVKLPHSKLRCLVLTKAKQKMYKFETPKCGLTANVIKAASRPQYEQYPNSHKTTIREVQPGDLISEDRHYQL